MLFGNIIFNACNWLLGIAITKLSINESVALSNTGSYMAAVALCQPVGILATLHLRGALVTDVKGAHPISDYFGLRLITSVIGFFLTAAVVLATNSVKPDLILICLATAAGIAFDSIGDILQGYLQREEKMNRIGASFAIRGILTLLFLVAAFVATHSVLWAVVGSASASFITTFFYDLPNVIKELKSKEGSHWKQVFGPTFSRPELTRLLATAWPLGVTVALTTLNVYMGRIVLNQAFDEKSVAIFGACQSLIAIGQTVIFSLGSAVGPRLARFYSAGEAEAFKSLTKKFVSITLAMGAAGFLVSIVFGSQLIALIYRKSFVGDSRLFPTLMIGGLVLYASLGLGQSLTSARKFKDQMASAMAQTVVSFAALLVGVRLYGIMGAAYASIVGYAVRLGMLGWIYRKQILKAEGVTV